MMRPEYDGVKFYSVHDWGIGELLAKAAIILESFDENEKYTDINKVIEDTVEYTTRTDWRKGWTAVTSITPTEEMMEGLRNSRTELTENGSGTTWDKDNGLKLIDMMITDENGNYLCNLGHLKMFQDKYLLFI